MTSQVEILGVAERRDPLSVVGGRKRAGGVSFEEELVRPWGSSELDGVVKLFRGGCIESGRDESDGGERGGRGGEEGEDTGEDVQVEGGRTG